MRIEAVSIGVNPPQDVNVIIEVPVGGEPIKYEMDKAAGTLVAAWALPGWLLADRKSVV